METLKLKLILLQSHISSYTVKK